MQRYSLITQTSAGDWFSVHRLVRRYFLDRSDSTRCQQGLDSVVRLLRQEFPRQSPFAEPLSGEWPQCERWISHVISVNETANSFHGSLRPREQLAELFLDAAIYLWERGLLDSGKKLILAAKEICERQRVDEGLKSDVYAFHATFLAESGDLEGALVYFEKQAQNRRDNLTAIRVRKKCDPTIVDDIQLANAFNNLAGIYFALNQLEKAELYNELSLKIKEHWRHEGELDYLLSLSYSNIANVYGRQGRWDEAANYYAESLEASKNSRDTLKRALTYHNFGCMRLAQGQSAAARDLLSEAFQLRSEKLGNHFDTANTLHMLASCHFLLEDFHAAR
jgi:tetratricopeptide (TPR) repeat protein